MRPRACAEGRESFLDGYLLKNANVFVQKRFPTLSFIPTDLAPNPAKRGNRLVSELGRRYDPRFDFSGPSCARSTLLLRMLASNSLKLFLLNDLSDSYDVPFPPKFRVIFTPFFHKAFALRV